MQYKFAYVGKKLYLCTGFISMASREALRVSKNKPTYLLVQVHVISFSKASGRLPIKTAEIS